MRILVTGACGFVGSHILEHLTRNWSPYIKDIEVIAMDGLTYAGRLDRIEHLRHKNVKFVYHDFRNSLSSVLKQIGDVDFIIHNGAETHVSRSFANPGIFVESNIIGTLNVLEAARILKPKKFIYVSTDEVLGPAKDVPFDEQSELQPTNPYAAAKASGEVLAHSYYRSFGVPVVITRTMNMFGERQHPEKFVPMTIKKILAGQKVLIHGKQIDGQWVSGSRNWLHARVQVDALEFLLYHGRDGEIYHVGGTAISNRDIAQIILEATSKYSFAWDWMEPNTPIHDFSYSLDGSKLKVLGWSYPSDVYEDLKKTVQWTVQHQEFLEE